MEPAVGKSFRDQLMETAQRLEAVKAADMATPAAAVDLDPLLPSRTVCALVGRITTMTLWRWSHNPRIAFPPPDVIISQRRYWRASTIRRWQEQRGTATATP
jgi:hypothetical protein